MEAVYTNQIEPSALGYTSTLRAAGMVKLKRVCLNGLNSTKVRVVFSGFGGLRRLPRTGFVNKLIRA